MSRYFVLSTDPLSSAQEKELEAKLEAVIWWHWLPNFWLIKDSKEQVSSSDIRDMIHSIDDSKRCLVMQVDHSTWAAVTKPDAHGNDMVTWIRNHWDKVE